MSELIVLIHDENSSRRFQRIPEDSTLKKTVRGRAPPITTYIVTCKAAIDD